MSEAYEGLVRPTPADDKVPLQQTGLQSSASQTRMVWEVGALFQGGSSTYQLLCF